MRLLGVRGKTGGDTATVLREIPRKVLELVTERVIRRFGAGPAPRPFGTGDDRSLVLLGKNRSAQKTPRAVERHFDMGILRRVREREQRLLVLRIAHLRDAVVVSAVESFDPVHGSSPFSSSPTVSGGLAVIFRIFRRISSGASGRGNSRMPPELIFACQKRAWSSSCPVWSG